MAHDSLPNNSPFGTPEVRAALAALKVVSMPPNRNFPTRKPLKRVYDGVNIPRPRNSWILYRSDILTTRNEEAVATGKRLKRQASLSQDIAACWRGESPDVWEYYGYLAQIEKIEHKALYPDYKFRPKTRISEICGPKGAKNIERQVKLAPRARGLPSPATRPQPCANVR